MKETIFSEDRIYRYTLWRDFGGDNLFEGVNKTKEGYVQFIGLNPSTADETKDDPTIRKCRGFAKRWGYNSLCMTNLFAFRATKPADMMRFDNPTGADNKQHLLSIAADAALIIACWGANGGHRNQDFATVQWLSGIGVKLYRFDTATKQPQHPLYVAYETKLIPVVGYFK